MIDLVLEKAIDEWVEENRDSFIRDWISLVNIKSVSQPGQDGYALGKGCADCLHHALDIGRGWGLPTENDDNYCGSILLQGSGSGELGIVGHLDVVPEGPGWHYDPYHATKKEGYIIGRGAGDNKGPVVTSIYTLKCMKELGIKLSHTVRVLMGCDEENGMRDMDHFLKHHEAPRFSLCCDGTFALHHGEKGILEAELSVKLSDSRLLEFSGGVASNSVASNATAVLQGISIDAVRKAVKNHSKEIAIVGNDDRSVQLHATGVARHAAFPEGSVNAIGLLAGVLAEAQILDDTTTKAMQFLSAAFADYHGVGLNIAFQDEISGKITHVGGMVKLQDGVLIQDINLRYPITMKDSQPLLEQLHTHCGNNGFNVNIRRNSSPMYISLEDPILQMLIKTCREVLRRDDLYPFVMGGGTHCRKLPNMVGYGPSVPHANGKIGPALKPKFGDAHGPDEAMHIQTMLDGIKVYVITLMRLDEMLQED